MLSVKGEILKRLRFGVPVSRRHVWGAASGLLFAVIFALSSSLPEMNIMRILEDDAGMLMLQDTARKQLLPKHGSMAGPLN
jgi:hypothetical protein